MTQHFYYLTARIFPQMIDGNAPSLCTHTRTKCVQHWNSPYLNNFDHLVSSLLSNIDKSKYISYTVNLMEKITGMSLKDTNYLPLQVPAAKKIPITFSEVCNVYLALPITEQKFVRQKGLHNFIQ